MQTIRDAIQWIGRSKRWGWTGRLWTELNVIAAKNGRTFTVKDINAPADGIERLGCCGHDGECYRWIGFDFDVGHGPTPYPSTERARDHAVALVYAAQEKELPAAVATSSGGDGLHVFVLTTGLEAKISSAKERGQFVAMLLEDGKKRVGSTGPLHPDPAPLSAQRFFLFNRNNEKAHALLRVNAAWERR